MKKIKSLAILLSAAFLLAGCSENASSSNPPSSQESPEESSSPIETGESSSSSEESSSLPDYSGTYAIFFHSLGGSEVPTQRVEEGQKATRPEDPTYEGYTFAGWYLSETGDDLFDFDTIINSDYHLYARWNIEGQGDGDPVPMTIYFRDASWWSISDAITYIKLGDDDSDFGVPMENIRFCEDEYKGVGYNYWKFDIPDITVSKTAQFVRMGPGGAYWNAWAGKADLLSAGENNLYDIRESEETWGAPVNGEWAVYDPNDMGNPDAGEPPAEYDPGYYVVGTMNGWAATRGYKLNDNPNEPGELMILDLYLSAGTEFKIHDTTPNANTWLGVSNLDPESPAKAHLGGTDNIVANSSGYYDFYVQDGVIWATVDLASYSIAFGPEFEEGEQLSPNGDFFTISLSLEEGEQFKILGLDGSSFGYENLDASYAQLKEGPDGSIEVVSAGYFTISFEVEEGAISVSYEAEAPEATTIYFADEEWWNQAGAETRVSLDGSAVLLDMTFLRLCPNQYIGEGYKYWSIDIVGLENYQTIEFVRCDPATGVSWGTSTGAISLADRGENNLYSIRGAAEWANPTPGKWEVYDPSDNGNPDATERPAREVYLVGQIGGETVNMPFSSNNVNEVKLLDVALNEGDSFAIRDEEADLTIGFTSIKKECPLLSSFSAGEGNSFTVVTSGTYDFYYDFNIGAGESVWIG